MMRTERRPHWFVPSGLPILPPSADVAADLGDAGENVDGGNRRIGYEYGDDSAASSRCHTSGRNCSRSLSGVWPIFASTLRRYACGPGPCASVPVIRVHSAA